MVGTRTNARKYTLSEYVYTGVYMYRETLIWKMSMHVRNRNCDPTGLHAVYLSPGSTSLVQFMISGAAVLLFSGFILYDTSNILRHYGTDEHVSATLALYLDILNLFIALLSILGIARNE